MATTDHLQTEFLPTTDEYLQQDPAVSHPNQAAELTSKTWGEWGVQMGLQRRNLGVEEDDHRYPYIPKLPVLLHLNALPIDGGVVQNTIEAGIVGQPFIQQMNIFSVC